MDSKPYETAVQCVRCWRQVKDVVAIGRYSFCGSCFWGWAELNAERIVAEVPPVETRPELPAQPEADAE